MINHVVPLSIRTGISSIASEKRRMEFLEKRCAVVSASETLLKIFGDEATVPATNLRELAELETILAQGFPGEDQKEVIERRYKFVSQQLFYPPFVLHSPHSHFALSVKNRPKKKKTSWKKLGHFVNLRSPTKLL
jgi:hypothetical protein